jgi:type IV pilus assembly protein PilE
VKHEVKYEIKSKMGLTLIELMVVLVIISLLAALAWPTFQFGVIKAKRAQAQAALLQLMQQQERYYTQHNTYLAFSSLSVDTGQFKWWSGDIAARSAYEVQAIACPGLSITQCVRLTAMPGTDKVDRNFKDVHCEALSIDSAGQRRASGAAPGCWP